MFAGDEQDAAETALVQVSGLAHNVIDGEGGAQDAGITGKAAVAAIVDALVGDVKRRKKPHGSAEMAAGRLLALAGEVFQRAAGFLGKQTLETPHQGSGAL